MLYNKNDQGTQELVDRLGFFADGFPFKRIAPYLEDAARELKALFSPEVYRAVEAHYHSKDFDPLAPDTTALSGKDIVTRSFQKAAGAMAYLIVAPNTDLTHDDSGRNINLPDNQHLAYDSKLERSNDALRETVSTTIDTIYCLLEQYGDDFPQWHQSTQYNMAKDTLLPTAGDFSAVFDIGGSYYLFRKLAPSLRIGQEAYIRPLLGEKVFQAVLSDRTNTDSLSLLARRALAVRVMADHVVSASFDYYPRNIVPAKATLPDRNAERENLMALYRTLTDSIRDILAAREAAAGGHSRPKTKDINDPKNLYFYNGQ